MNKLVKYSLFVLLSVLSFKGIAQKTERKGEFYISWGYNKEWYTNSNVSIHQPSLGNNFTFKNTKLEDHPGWDDAILTKAISIPQ